MAHKLAVHKASQRHVVHTTCHTATALFVAHSHASSCLPLYTKQQLHEEASKHKCVSSAQLAPLNNYKKVGLPEAGSSGSQDTVLLAVVSTTGNGDQPDNSDR